MTHHHHGGAPHPPHALAPSLLRLSVVGRLALAAGLIAVVWTVALWAMH